MTDPITVLAIISLFTNSILLIYIGVFERRGHRDRLLVQEILAQRQLKKPARDKLGRFVKKAK